MFNLWIFLDELLCWHRWRGDLTEVGLDGSVTYWQVCSKCLKVREVSERRYWKRS